MPTRINQRRIWIIAASLFIVLFRAAIADSSDILAGGSWTNRGYDIAGEWQIVEREGNRFIIFDNNFKTRSGPDLKVYLSKTRINQLDGSDVDQSSIKIGALQSSEGAQEYQIPNELILDSFKSVVIHCEKYAHLWGGSDIH